ncbi:MAG: 3-hydroxyacyl-CoA dehydrogenase family protein [Actinomycetota bacterium]
MSAGIEAGLIRTVGVVGAGAMGRGIAESSLRNGYAVVLQDTSAAALEQARQQLEASLQRSVAKAELTTAEAPSLLSGLTVSQEQAELHRCELIIEAVPELLTIKTEVLSRIEQHAAADAVIASNTSSLPITKLAVALQDPSRFLGLHFFNPVPRMGLVEVIPTVLTGDRALETARDFARSGLQKTTLTIDDRPGFVVNALLIPYILAAARMQDTGYASAEDIDSGMRLACAHPMGPLELADFIGLDIVCHVADAVHSETHDPAMVVPNNLRRRVEAGHLGRKTGRGFHRYS